VALNPGYKVIAKKKKMECDPGPEFKCPFCQHIILEAKAERFRTRCKNCGHWVYAEKLAAAG